MKRSSLAKPQADRIDKSLVRLFESDKVGWLEESVDLIKRKKFAELDYVHLARYLRYWAKRDKQEVRYRLETLLANWLSLPFYSGANARRNRVGLLRQQFELEGLLDSPTLKTLARTLLPGAYENAVRRVAARHKIAKARFPGQCPHALDDLLGDAILAPRA